MRVFEEFCQLSKPCLNINIEMNSNMFKKPDVVGSGGDYSVIRSNVLSGCIYKYPWDSLYKVHVDFSLVLGLKSWMLSNRVPWSSKRSYLRTERFFNNKTSFRTWCLLRLLIMMLWTVDSSGTDLIPPKVFFYCFCVGSFEEPIQNLEQFGVLVRSGSQPWFRGFSHFFTINLNYLFEWD